MNKTCRRYFVSGKVQGVFFRASTARRAVKIGITGYARNLPDGRVEVLACGDEPALATMEEWLWHGPPASRVTAVEGTAADCAEVPAAFETA